MRPPVSSRRPLAAALACLGLALVAHVHGYRLFLQRLDTTRTVYARPAPVDEVAPPGPARRLWVVVLDGLRGDRAAQLPTLSRLAARGVLRPLVAEFPSYTFPNTTAMTTGVPPAWSGVRLNSGAPHVPLGTLLASAARAGVPTVIASDWDGFDGALDRDRAAALPHVDVEHLLARPAAHEIAWVHFRDVDDAGHAHGAASPQYRDAALRADSLVGTLALALDADRDTLVVLSDHGHRDGGGHGGVEPEVRDAFLLAFGAGIRRDVHLEPRPMRDVAGTLAILAGLAPPVDNLGTPMTDLLALPPDRVARALAPSWRQRHRADAGFALASDADAAIAARLSDGSDAVIAPAVGELRRRDRARDQAYEARVERRELVGALALTPFALAVLAGLWLLHRRGTARLRLRDHAPLALYTALFFGGYFALGLRVTWSVQRGVAAFIAVTGVLGILACVVALVVGRRLARERLAAQGWTIAWGWAAYLVCAGSVGLDPAFLPTPWVGFLMLLVATVVFWFALGYGLALLVAAWRNRSSKVSA